MDKSEKCYFLNLFVIAAQFLWDQGICNSTENIWAVSVARSNENEYTKMKTKNYH
jgi:hypothetical protein